MMHLEPGSIYIDVIEREKVQTGDTIPISELKFFLLIPGEIFVIRNSEIGIVSPI
jgi:hypothetical protein